MSLKSHFLRVLRGNEAQRIHFSFRGVGGFLITVNSQNFRTVATAISNGTITLNEGATGSYSAFYKNSGKQFMVNPQIYKGSRQFDALLIHESVHASFHLMGMKIPAFDHETAGYIAQGYYLRNSGFRRHDELNDLEFFGQQSIQTGDGVVDESMLLELRKSLLAHSAYQRKKLTFILNIIGFNI